jgi:hypothetical protein
MFEILFQAEARRRAGRRRDLAAAGLAAGLVALAAYGVAEGGGPGREPGGAGQAPVGSAAPRTAEPARPVTRRDGGGPPRPGAPRSAAAAAAPPAAAARPASRATAASAPGAAPRRSARTAPTAERTELAVETVGGRPGGVAVERVRRDAEPARLPGGAPAPAPDAPATSRGRPGSPPTWRITPNTAGTHRLELVAVDVRDGPGGPDTVARRSLGVVD